MDPDAGATRVCARPTGRRPLPPAATLPDRAPRRPLAATGVSTKREPGGEDIYSHGPTGESAPAAARQPRPTRGLAVAVRQPRMRLAISRRGGGRRAGPRVPRPRPPSARDCQAEAEPTCVRALARSEATGPPLLPAEHAREPTALSSRGDPAGAATQRSRGPDANHWGPRGRPSGKAAELP